MLEGCTVARYRRDERMKAIQEVFNDRTCYRFSDRLVSDDLLQEIYDIAKLGPTSGNSCPMRIMFVKSLQEKEKLYKCLDPFNLEKVRSAPVTAIFAYDLKFYELMNVLYPTGKALREHFASNADLALDTAQRNSTLQAAYFMMVARSKGLDCGPLSGFNQVEVNKTFFSGSSYCVNFLCNLGYKAAENQYPRLPRLDFKQCCKIV